MSSPTTCLSRREHALSSRTERRMRMGAAVMFGSLLTSLPTATPAQTVGTGESGREISFDRARGNCLACHTMPTVEGAEQPGNAGPPLIAMQARFPDKRVLRAKIWDATASNPQSFMPPMGKHQILTEDEIDKVVDFVYGL
jgi:L-cysteine S-thiosulfotransferase